MDLTLFEGLPSLVPFDNHLRYFLFKIDSAWSVKEIPRSHTYVFLEACVSKIYNNKEKRISIK